MVDLASRRAAILALLRTLPGVTVYDGYVPKAVPEAGGYVLPYVVLWAGVDDEIPERDLSGRVDMDGSRWDFQTTAVGAAASICAAVASDVRRALANHPMGTYYVLPNPDGFNREVPRLDPSVTPSRFFLPQQWRSDTT